MMTKTRGTPFLLPSLKTPPMQYMGPTRPFSVRAFPFGLDAIMQFNHDDGCIECQEIRPHSDSFLFRHGIVRWLSLSYNDAGRWNPEVPRFVEEFMIYKGLASFVSWTGCPALGPRYTALGIYLADEDGHLDVVHLWNGMAREFLDRVFVDFAVSWEGRR